MFARILGKKKSGESTESKEEQKIKKLMEVTAKVDSSIRENERKLAAYENLRKKTLEAAKVAKLAKRNAELQRLAQKIKSIDSATQRLNTMASKLESTKDTCESFLMHSDFLSVVKETQQIVDMFGMKIEDAQTIMDKAQDMKDNVKDMDDAMNQDVEEQDLSDIFGEIDQEIAAEADKANPLPAIPTSIPKEAPAQKAPVQKAPAQSKYDADLEEMLAGL